MGWEGGWEDEMSVGVAPTLSQQQISIQSRGCSRCNFCISSSSSLRERERDPSMYRNVRSLKLLPVMSEEKTGHFYICSRHTRSQIPFFR